MVIRPLSLLLCNEGDRYILDSHFISYMWLTEIDETSQSLLIIT